MRSAIWASAGPTTSSSIVGTPEAVKTVMKRSRSVNQLR